MKELPELYDPARQIDADLLARKNPVFDDALAMQEQFDAEKIHLYDSSQQAYDVAKRAAQELDYSKGVAELLGKRAVLSGRALYLPENMGYAFYPNQTIIVASHNWTDSENVGAPIVDEPEDYCEVDGTFQGFAGSARVVGETVGAIASFRPELVYQVSYPMNIASPLLNGQLCAAGIVGKSNLEFDEDRRIEGLIAATHNLALASLQNPVLDKSIQGYIKVFEDIDSSILSKKILQKINSDIKDVACSGHDPRGIVADMMMELMRNELLGRNIFVKASQLTRISQKDYKQGIAVEGGRTIEIVQTSIYAPISDIVMLPMYVFDTEKATQGETVPVLLGDPAVHLCFYSNERRMYVALDDVTDDISVEE